MFNIHILEYFFMFVDSLLTTINDTILFFFFNKYLNVEKIFYSPSIYTAFFNIFCILNILDQYNYYEIRFSTENMFLNYCIWNKTI